MEKTIILVLLLLVLTSCNQTASDFSEEEVLQLYNEKIKDFDFDRFQCFNFLQWNQSRKNTEAEYHVEFFKGCTTADNNRLKPQRAVIRLKNGNPEIISTDIPPEYLPTSLLKDFYQLGISNLFYSTSPNLGITVYPNVKFIKDCEESVDENKYTFIEDCWYYELN